jgi:hypothetical protein
MAKPRRTKKEAALILSVGALLNSLVVLVAYLTNMSAELQAMVFAVVGAALAVWQAGSGVSVEPMRNQRGAARVQVLASIAVIIGSLIIFAGALAAVMSATGCNPMVVADQPSRVDFDLDRKTCRLVVDVDGERKLEIKPGPETKCDVEVKP